jgi:ketosteroid isomerase-like protein
VREIRRRRFPIIGDGRGMWSFVHIDDVANATAAAIERGEPGIYDVVDDEPAPVAVWLPELAAAIGAKPPRRVPVWLGRLVAGGLAVVVMTEIRGSSNVKAKRELDRQPRFASWREASGRDWAKPNHEGRPARWNWSANCGDTGLASPFTSHLSSSAVGTASRSAPACRPCDGRASMSVDESVAIVLAAFRAVEQRDEQRLLELYHPEVEFHWPPSLPFGGSSRGRRRDRSGPSWSEVWDPLQPGEVERGMDPQVVAATEREVVVRWRQRGVSPSGERFVGEVLGLYEVRDGKFARAQMFYFDSVAVQRFLDTAAADADPPSTSPSAGR